MRMILVHLSAGYCDTRSPAPKALAAKYGMPPSAESVLKAKFGI